MRLARRPEGSDAPQECQRWRLSLKSKGNKYKAARPERQGACYRMKYNEHRGSHVRTYLRNVHTYVRMYVVKTEASRCKHYIHAHMLLPACVQYLAAFSMVSRHDFSSERALSRLFTFSCKWRWMCYYGRHTYAQTDSTVRTYVRMYNSVLMRSSTNLPFLTPDALLLTLFDPHLQDFILHHCAA